MDRITERLKITLMGYTGKGIGCWLFPLFDDHHQTYGVIGIDYPSREDRAGVVVFTRLSDQHIIIEEDRTDRKLVDDLIQAGIPREQIILAYDGELQGEVEPTF